MFWLYLYLPFSNQCALQQLMHCAPQTSFTRHFSSCSSSSSMVDASVSHRHQKLKSYHESKIFQMYSWQHINQSNVLHTCVISRDSNFINRKRKIFLSCSRLNKIFLEKQLTNICSANMYASFSTFWVKIGQESEP